MTSWWPFSDAIHTATSITRLRPSSSGTMLRVTFSASLSSSALTAAASPLATACQSCCSSAGSAEGQKLFVQPLYDLPAYGLTALPDAAARPARKLPASAIRSAAVASLPAWLLLLLAVVVVVVRRGMLLPSADAACKAGCAARSIGGGASRERRARLASCLWQGTAMHNCGQRVLAPTTARRQQVCSYQPGSCTAPDEQLDSCRALTARAAILQICVLGS
jgi:hypothetical protein